MRVEVRLDSYESRLDTLYLGRGTNLVRFFDNALKRLAPHNQSLVSLAVQRNQPQMT
jgi:hypothetical protein